MGIKTGYMALKLPNCISGYLCKIIDVLSGNK